MKRTLVCTLIAFTFFGIRNARSQPAQQSPASPPVDRSITRNHVIGEVTAIDPAARQVTVKTGQGETVAVMLDDQTVYMRVPDGERSLAHATKIALSDVKPGSFVYVRGPVAQDRKSVPAEIVALVDHSRLSARDEPDREEWLRRGLFGRVAAINPETREITLSTRSRGDVRQVILPAGGNVRFRRYAPDSVRFGDAAPSSFGELRVGDQLRALGQRSADGSRFTPEEIVSGSFRTSGGRIASIAPSPAGAPTIGQLKIIDSRTNAPLTVIIYKDSLMRRLTPEMARGLAERASRADSAGGKEATTASTRRSGDPGAGGKPGRDFRATIEHMPAIALSDLKPGDLVLVSSTTGSDPSRVTAMTVVTGDPDILTRFLPGAANGELPVMMTGLPALIGGGINPPPPPN